MLGQLNLVRKFCQFCKKDDNKKRGGSVAPLPSEPCRDNCKLNGQRLLCRIYNSRECSFVMHCQIGKHSTIQSDTGLSKTSDQAAIAQTFRTGLRVDTSNPKRTEVTLFNSTIAVGILTGFDNSLFSNSKYS